MFVAKIIDAKGRVTEVTARMRYAVYVKQYYGNKIVAMFENISGAEDWCKKNWAGAEVVAYDDFEYSLPWTLGRPVAVAAHHAEMGTDDVFPPEIFWSEAEFWQRWVSGRRIVAIHRFKAGAKFRAEGRPKARVIVEPRKEWNGYGLIANFER